MTNKEKDVLESLVIELKKENQEIKQTISMLSKELIKKEEQEKLPFSLEKNIQTNINNAINESITKTLLDDYNSPLKKLVAVSINKYEKDILEKIENSLTNVLNNGDFNLFLQEAVKNKISRELLGAVESNLTKSINSLKQDAVFRSKLVLCINDLVDNYKK